MGGVPVQVSQVNTSTYLSYCQITKGFFKELYLGYFLSYLSLWIWPQAENFTSMAPKQISYVKVMLKSFRGSCVRTHSFHLGLPGLKIFFGRWPDTKTSQRNFCLVKSCFWPVKKLREKQTHPYVFFYYWNRMWLYFYKGIIYKHL